MLEKINAKDLNFRNCLALINYFNELDICDKVFTIKNFDIFIQTLTNHGYMNPIYHFYPWQSDVISGCICEQKNVTEITDIDSNVIQNGIKCMPQYNFVISQKIFHLNGLVLSRPIMDIFSSKINYTNSNLDDIYNIMNKIKGIYLRGLNSNNSKSILYLIFKYVLKYKIISKFELLKVYKDMIMSKINEQQNDKDYVERCFVDIINFIDSPSISLLDNTILRNCDQDIRNLLIYYIHAYEQCKKMSLKEIPFDDTLHISKDIGISFMGNINDQLIEFYLDDIVKIDVSKIPVKEDVSFDVPANAKFAIISDMGKECKFSNICTSNGESRFLIKENGSNEIYMSFTDGKTISSVNIMDILNESSSIKFMEFADIDLDSEYELMLICDR